MDIEKIRYFFAKRIAIFKNVFFDFFSGDRRCSNCRHLEERPHQLDLFVHRVTRRPYRTVKWCSLTNSHISDREVYTKKCVDFKRKYGRPPITRKLFSYGRRAKKEWQLHRTTIGVIAAILGVIVGLFAILVSKGFI